PLQSRVGWELVSHHVVGGDKLRRYANIGKEPLPGLLAIVQKINLCHSLTGVLTCDLDAVTVFGKGNKRNRNILWRMRL
ncbi:MAG: hypothetical protein AB1744_08015, partial [Candidatus Zixiibacteriota bacterium]